MAFPKIVTLALRGFEFFWTLLIMALVGAMIHNATHGNPSIINYEMFLAVFSMLSLFYAIPATVMEFGVHPLAMILLDALNTLFFFAGGVALAVKLRVHSCSNQGYLKTNGITNGAHNMKQRCHEAQAVTAFTWFCFFCYLASLVASALSGSSSGGGFSLRSGGIGRRPQMSHV